MGFANGRIPASALMGIPGNGRLIRAAAIAWTAMYLRARRDGVSLIIIENWIRRTYREFAAQVAARRMWCNLGRCGNAAPPGFSNHGWGTTVDLMSLLQRAWIDRHGAFYGWAKRWSDAPWEWWHIRWRAGIWHGHLHTGPRVLRKGSRRGKDVAHLKHLLHRVPLKHNPHRRYWRARWKINGVYGLRVRRAVRRFQGDHGMKVDGIVGPKTWAAIKRAAHN